MKRAVTYKQALAQRKYAAKKGQAYGRKMAQAARAMAPYTNPSLRGKGFLKIRVKVEPTSHLITSTSVAAGYYSYAFSLNDLPDVTSYSSIYDQYRFDKITAIITPANQINNPAAASAWAPLVTAIDLDDSAIPSSYNQILAFGTSFVHDPMAGAQRRSWVPCSAVGAIDTGGTYTNKSIQKYKWMDMSSTGVAHYGFKAVVKQNTSTSQFYYYIYFIYDVSFMSTR